MILCLGTTPAAQRVMIFPRLVLDSVNRAVETLDGAAGKSVNVAKVLHALGAKPVATGFFGGPRGEQLEHILRARGIELDVVPVDTPTRECVTIVDQAADTITELVEESRPVAPAAYEKLMTMFQRRLPQCQAVVLSGTIAAGGPPDLYFQCASLARKAGILAAVDASGTALLQALEARPGVVKPNRAELQATAGRELTSETDLLRAMRELHTRGAERVVVTAGAKPTLAFDGKGFWRISGPEVHALNPIGSGDAFTAALVWRLAGGDDLGEACRWGAAAGAANALTPMAGEVSRDEVVRLLPEVKVERL